ncbi:hypothetical protein Poly30_52360 [Planctomycetes bacterium Poly30]|uniref:Uncharacterized protein n=1 Tax=Saltatorellus ferox TaxID=2528018 RepID=A0A518F011_9BACT|nr:hypothetical protein Poly30_52360 [Planctomycetes bacterium Poly30]
MGRFETSSAESSKWLRPVTVPSSKGGVFGTVRELLDDLPGWDVDSVDEENLRVHVSKKNGFLGGTSKIVITVSGPEGIPSSQTDVSSESDGLLSRDKSNVSTFCRKLWMRVT